MNYISSFFRTAEKGEDKKYTKNGIMLLTCRVIILGMTLLYIVKAFIGAYYHEIDSYVLPTISMEYRHSLLITQEDIGQAKIDYPEYYKDEGHAGQMGFVLLPFLFCLLHAAEADIPAYRSRSDVGVYGDECAVRDCGADLHV